MSASNSTSDSSTVVPSPESTINSSSRGGILLVLIMERLYIERSAQVEAVTSGASIGWASPAPKRCLDISQKAHQRNGKIHSIAKILSTGISTISKITNIDAKKVSTRPMTLRQSRFKDSDIGREVKSSRSPTHITATKAAMTTVLRTAASLTGQTPLDRLKYMIASNPIPDLHVEIR